MSEEMMNLSFHEKEKKTMRRVFSRCGWAIFATTLGSLAASLIISIIVGMLDASGIGATDLYNEYLLYINAFVVALGVGIGALVLLGMPKVKAEKRSVPPKVFFMLFAVCYAIGTAGNTIGNLWLTFWNTATGNEVTNQLAELLMAMDPLQMVICTGILAPIMEEFLFRKLLIDRTRAFGELPAILVSALLFGLFHQNFSQFFYAFGIGIVLGYLYCRTGSYLMTTLLHMVFNFVGGVIPSLLSTELFGFLEAIETLSEAELMEALPTLAMEHATPLLIYGVYLMLVGIINIAGVIFFITNIKKVRVDHAALTLSPIEMRKAALVNAGMIAAIVIFIIFMILSLFPTA